MAGFVRYLKCGLVRTFRIQVSNDYLQARFLFLIALMNGSCFGTSQCLVLGAATIVNHPAECERRTAHGLALAY